MDKEKALTQKQKQRNELNKVLDSNEKKLVAMQKKDWRDFTDEEVCVLEHFLAVSMETMRHCPPAYVMVASNTVAVRFKKKAEELKAAAEDVKP